MYLGHLWEEADGEGQGQAEGSETHQRVDGKDQPPLSLQQRKPGGTQRTEKQQPFTFKVHVQDRRVVGAVGGTEKNVQQSEKTLKKYINTTQFYKENRIPDAH